MKKIIKNLTPHEITIVGENGEIILSIKPEPISARAKASTVKVGAIEVEGKTIPLTTTKMGEVEGLPPEEKGTMLIVSRIVAEACPNRHDLVIPNESVRDDKGRIVGVKSLAILPRKEVGQ